MSGLFIGIALLNFQFRRNSGNMEAKRNAGLKGLSWYELRVLGMKLRSTKDRFDAGVQFQPQWPRIAHYEFIEEMVAR